MDEVTKEILSRYYVEDARLLYSKGRDLDGKGQALSFTKFAEKGHWISEGTGIVASKRYSVAQQFGMARSSYTVEQLTIALPEREGNEGTYLIDPAGNDGAIVFWSSWSHGGFACFSYATSGSIQVKRLQFPSSMAPERLRFFYRQPVRPDAIH